MDVPEAMSTPRAGRSWMHSLFHEWRDATGFLNFCRLCNVDQPSVDEVLTVTRSGGNIQSHWFGAVTAETASGMINHIRKFHPEELPDGVSLHRKRSGDQVAGAPRANMTLVQDWAQHSCSERCSL